MRTGDIVEHVPSGETWVLAYADADRNKVGPCGWPESMAAMSDCTLVKAATDDEFQKTLEAVRKLPRSDSRRRAVDYLYPAAEDGQ